MLGNPNFRKILNVYRRSLSIGGFTILLLLLALVLSFSSPVEASQKSASTTNNIPAPSVAELDVPALASELVEGQAEEAEGVGVSGAVFRDYNANGARDSREPGVAGITVTAYDASGATVDSTTTAADGTYMLNVAADTEVRVEFSGMPAYLQAGASGSDSETGVTFATSPATGVDMGLNNPAHYCQQDPTLVTPCYIFGDQAGQTADVLVSFDYDAGCADDNLDGNCDNAGETFTDPAPTHIASGQDIGTTWGVAYQGSSDSLFVASFMKRHTGFRNHGDTGVIYRVDGASAGGTGISAYVDLDALGFDTGTDPHPTSLTSCGSVANAPDDDCWGYDPDSWDAVGKISFGDIDISDDGNSLWTINLLDRKLYQIPAQAAALTANDINTYDIPSPADCVDASTNLRPFATGFNDGLVYVGMVCTAETTQDAADMRAYVYSMDPAVGAGSFAEVLNAPLNYARGNVVVDNGGSPVDIPAEWNPWVTTFTTHSAGAAWSSEYGYPQPWLTDIEFDNGDLIVGIRDRYGDQMGYKSPSTDLTDTTLYSGDVAGDILRACPNGSGGWDLESDGSCGGVSTGGSGNAEGPGGGEFYFEENYPIHDEISVAGLVQVPGSSVVVETVFDPIYDFNEYFDGGVVWLNNDTGTRSNAYRLFSSNDNDPDTFGKAGGLGDMEALCGPAPLEIGNRVWQDTNGNGIQDPGEPVLVGVTVTLHDMDNNGNQIGSAVVDANGHYIFGGVLGSNMTGALLTNHNYEVRIDLTDPNLNGLVPTAANQGNDNHDSDATGNGGFAVIPVTTGDAGANNHTYDFGFEAESSYSLGDTVWYDTNQNGIQDAGEPGVENVTVELHNNATCTASTGQTVTTDGMGFYEFTGLGSGSYCVQFSDIPAGWEISPPDQGDDDAVDSDANNDGQITDISLGPDDPTNDMGIYASGSVGDQVWCEGSNPADTSYDGGTDDSPLAGIGVMLYADNDCDQAADGDALMSMDTDVNGQFSFAGLSLLPAGSNTCYVVEVDTSDADLGNCDQPITPPSVPVELNPETPTNDGTDFGFEEQPKYTLGDTVWYDTNQDGIQDNGESGVKNITAELFSDATCTTSTGMTMVTDVAGFYEFTDLMAGDYCVQFSNIPVGWSVSPADQGADDAIDSDATVMADPTMAQIMNINLTADDPTNDMGIYTTGSIGDQVWCEGSDPADNSYDGGTSDSPLPSILVNLYADSDCDDAADSATPLMSIDTDGNGQYSFTGLTVTPAGAPTCYVVQVDTTDTDVGACTDTITPDSYGVDLDTDNPDDDSSDFGFVEPPPVPTLTIGDTVWNDQDGDGVQDSGEPGVSGVTVTLYDNAGNVLNTTTTDENGNYLFTSDSDGNPLPAGDYQVGFTPPAGYLFTTADQGGDDENDSDADTTTGMTPVFTMAAGDTNLSLDAGLFMPAAIGNYVWQDEDENGKQDAGEQGIPNVKVILLDADGNPVAETTTDADGGYLFPDLPPGSYFVDVDESTLPEGMSQTPVATGNDIGADFNNQDHSGNGYPVTVGSGEENLTADFGYNPDPVDNGSIGDSIWVDTDGDGTQDPDEIGLADVCVELYSDPDGDGVYDNLVATTMTDANGNYIFNDVTPGAYVVKVCDSNFEPGGPLEGYDPTGDPDQPGIPAIDPDNMTTTPIVVGPGDVIDTIDFGYQPQDNTPLGSIGDTIWLDTDASGTPTQDAGENGIAGVTVALIEDTNGNGVQDDGEAIIATVTTDGNGNYLFEDLPLDTSYIVWVNDTDNLLADLKPTYDQDGIDTPNMSAITLTADNPNDLDQDFSYTPDTQEPNEGMIGDGIYFDHDSSGNPTPGDQLIPGVTVILTDENGTQTTTTTDETGHYFFGGLDPQGTYTVTVAPENFEPGGPLEGMDNTADPDGGLNSTSTVDLSQSPDGINLDQDFGYAAPPNEEGKIGNLIWLDTNADGVYDPATETPIAGVTVDLYQDSNNNGNIDAGEPLFATTTTANINPAAYGSDGNYIFEGLPAGSYVVDVTDVDGVLAGYSHSQGTPGENNNSQSDPYGVTIEAGGENLTADFGYYVNGASIGNFVWSDLNGDGIQNDGEPGIADVTVTLDITYPDGVTLTMVTTTNPDGYYLFDNLLLDEAFDGSGVYAEPGVGGGDEPYFNISVTTPNGYTPTQVDQGGNDLLDSDDHTGTQAIAQQGNNNVPTTPTDPATEDSVASYDFGFMPPVEGGSIGDFVWLDLDGDGVQDPGETGLPGVTVKLVDENGNVTTTTTDENGQYLFDGVPPGTYTIMVDPTTLPEDVAPSYDLDGILNNSTSITLQPGEDLDTVDFGYKPTPPELGAIGNYVWLDENTDGHQDAGEGGIPNVVVHLLDGDGNLIESTTTDTDGHYLFPDLPAGDYTVLIPDLNQDPDGALEGLTQSTAQPIPSGSDFGNQTTPYSITLGEGEENLTADFGYHIPSAAIGDFIWVDTDGDGMQDPEEAGVPGVTVNLYDDPDGDGVYDNLVGTATTDDNGKYLFDNLTPGAYVVEVVPTGSPIDGYTQTGDPDQPGETATNPDNMTTTPVIIGPGDVYLDADFGYKPADNTPVGSIGDTIWFDADGSGTPTMDADEYGIPGVTVALIKDENGNGIQDDGEPVIASDTTDENGNYLFEGLPLDTSYIVWVNDTDNVLDGLMPTYDKDGIATLDMSATTLTAGNPDDLEQDFSYTPEVVPPEALIGDTIYLDIDGDGTQDADEPGLQGVIVVLTDQNGNETTVVTNENGNYAFTDVNPDEQYTVTVAPENFQPGGVLEGLDNSGDPDGGNDSTSTVDLSTSGPINLDQDFGYTPQGPAGSIGNLVWLDTNADGVYDAASETPIGNVTVDLYSDLNGNGQVDAGEPLFGSAVTAGTIDSTQYGADGNYLFTGLPAGDYIVDVTDEHNVLAGLTHSMGTAGSDNNSQSDPYALSIPAGGQNLTADFGYYTSPASVGDTVWVDTDGDGTQDPEEAGAPGVTVNLYNDPDGDGVYDNLVDSTTTDENGNYLFDDLTPGAYVVKVVPTDSPIDGYTQTGDPDQPGQPATNPDNVTTSPVIVGPGDVYLDADFGYKPADTAPVGSIGDTIWFDADGSGTPTVDADEYGIPGVTVALIKDENGNGIQDDGEPVIAHDTTDENGNYLFEGLPLDTSYIVLVDDTDNVLDGLVPTYDQDGLTTPNKSATTLTAGSPDDLDQDFSYTPEGVQPPDPLIGDTIYLDTDGDGTQDPNEPGIQGVTVVLTDQNGNETTVVTDENGQYVFDNINPDEQYTVTVAPENFEPGGPLEGLDNSGDPDGGNDNTSTVDLSTSGPVNLEQDFGYTQTGSIGNLVWLDTNADGVYDPATEMPIADVTVDLYKDLNGNGQVDAGEPLFGSAVTAGTINSADYGPDGNYLFTGLPAGDYVVNVTDVNGVLAGMSHSLGTPGDDNNSQSDPYALSIPAGGQNLTADFGYHTPTGGVGDVVWVDTDGDGTQDPDEVGVEGVTVNLYNDPDGDGVHDNPVGTTTTDENGNYIFDNLPPGTYVVEVVPTGSPIDGYTQTGDPDQPGETATNPDNVTTIPVTVTPGDLNLDADFGYQPTDTAPVGSIGDTIWFDADASGTPTADAGENGIPDVTVALIKDENGNGIWDDGEPVIANDTTDENGNYLFEGLPLDTSYIVSVDDTNNVLDGLVPTYDQDGIATPEMSATTLTAGTPDDLEQDFSYAPEGQQPGDGLIGDSIYLDIDGDGTQDPDEPGLEGVIVVLTDQNGNETTVVTDENGQYVFEGINPDEQYTVTVAPENFEPGGVLEGLDNSGDPDGGNDNTSTVDLSTSGPINLDQDFGYTPQPGQAGSIGNLVWLDTNADGVYDAASETPIGNVTVDLYSDLNGNGQVDAGEPLFGSAVTADTISSDDYGPDGNYLFTGLPAGDYVVDVTDENGVLAGMTHSLGTAGDDNNSQSDPYALSIPAGGQNLTADFGYYTPPASVGGTLWTDTDGDGTQDPNELPVPGVTVNLYDDPDGDGVYDNLVGTTTTDENGNYVFDDVPPGTYVVEVVPTDSPIDGYTQTGDPDQPGQPATNPDNVTTTPVTVGPGDVYENGDFGYQPDDTAPVGSIGDTIWFDTDGSGTPTADAGENGISGVTVALIKDENGNGIWDNGEPTIANDITDENGNYLFEGLPVDTSYIVLVDDTNNVLDGLMPTYDEDGIGTPDMSATTLTAGSPDDLDQDFSYAPQEPQPNNGLIGDTIYLDTDGDGTQDPNEPGLEGVIVVLTDENGNQTTVVTNENGNYYFDGLNPDKQYTVTVAPENFQPGGVLQGFDNSGDPDGGNDNTSTVDLSTSGPTNLDQDFGYGQAGSLGNLVWLDTNADGVYDAASETPIGGVTIDLYRDLNGNGQIDAGEPLFGSAVTADTISSDDYGTDGNYLFSGLPAGNYIVDVTDENGVLAGLTHSLGTAGSDNNSQSDPYALSILAGGQNLTADFGYYTPPAAVNGTVWTDTDGDGVQDPNEAGVPDVTVNLYNDPDGDGVYDNLVGTTTTDENGNYLFDDLTPGTYVVEVVPTGSPIDGYTQTGDPDQPGQPATNPDNVTTGPITLNPGDVNPNPDFGYQPTDNTPVGSIGDTIWFDADESGTPTVDADEYGIPGVTVALIKDENGNGIQDDGEPVIAHDMTDENGNYLFEGLPLDTSYIVWVDDTNNVLAGLMPTYDKDGIDSPDMSATTLTADNPDDLDQDFSYAPGEQPNNGLIGDTIYLDIDGNGTQDADEPGLEGVIVVLTDESGNETTTVTDENGHYYFGDINPDGKYTVTVAPENFQPGGVLEGLDNSGDPDGGNDDTSMVDLSSSGPVNLDQDFGYTPQDGQDGSIGNLVWLDTNADGVYDPMSEMPIPGVTIDLYHDLNGNGQVDADEPLVSSAVTTGTINSAQYGPNGNYLFSGLPAGDYLVDVTDVNNVLAGMTHSQGTAGSDNNSQVDPYALSIPAGGQNLTADFGYYTPSAAVGNLVWLDTNGDGMQSAGEPGLPNVPVTLEITYPDGTLVTLVTNTNDDGYYSFDNLLTEEEYDGIGTPATPGTGGGDEPYFEISVATPDGYTPTQVDQGDNDLVDSDDHTGTQALPQEGQTSVPSTPTDPATEDSVASYDFGFQPPANLGSIGDSIWLDSNGDGVQDPDEVGISGVTIELLDSDGNVVATTTSGPDGTYLFNEVPAGTYTVKVDPSTLPEGVTQTFDLDGTPDNQTPVTLGEGEDKTDVDFGYEPAAQVGSIGDYVWMDTNGDGVQDPDEQPIPNVTVILTDQNGNQTTATTDANGQYLFEELPAGQYTITIDPNTLPEGVQQTFDLDGTLDHSTTVSLAPGQDKLDVDFGYKEHICMGTIGDTVFSDLNGNGTQDANEPGMADVIVKLVNAGEDGVLGTADDILISTQVTNVDGFYQFINLPAGLYQVQVDQNSVREGFALTTGNEPELTIQSNCEQFNDADFGYAPSVCERSVMYGVHDAGSFNTQFFKLDLATGSSSPLGPQYNNYDVEAIEMDPITNRLYAIAAGDGDQDGKFFEIDKETGALTEIGNTGTGDANEIVSAAFAADGTLWAYQQNVGLVTVDVTDGTSTVVWNHNGPGIANWEGLAWDPSGSYLYGAEGTKMYRFDPTDQSVTQVCDDTFLPDATEALDFRFDGKLLGGWHNATDNALSIFEIDMDTCSIIPTSFDTPYTDVESLTSEQCVEDGVVEGQVTNAPDQGGRASNEGGRAQEAASNAGIEVQIEADLNGDGKFEGEFTSQTTTDADGRYEFVNMPKGDYRVTTPGSGATSDFNLEPRGEPEDVNIDYTAVTTPPPVEFKLFLPTVVR